MGLRIEERFKDSGWSTSNEEAEHGFLLLAEEVRNWWRMCELGNQAIIYIIRSASKEEDGA